MEKKENDFRLFFRILFILFVAFLCLYSVSINGYLEKMNANKTLFTEEQIQKFESDVAKGEYVDINEYILPAQVDYSNSSSKLGEEVSKWIDYSADKSIEALNSFFAFLFS